MRVEIAIMDQEKTEISNYFKDYIKGNVTIDRFLIPFQIYGDHKTTTMLLVNGAQQAMGVWRPIIKKFGPNYRIVCFDFPGQGKGKILSGEFSVSLSEQLDILHSIVKTTCSSSDVIMVGFSWGYYGSFLCY